MAQTTKKVTRRQPPKRKLSSSPVKKRATRAQVKKINIALSRNKTLQISYKVKTVKRRKSKKNTVKKDRLIATLLILFGLLGIAGAGRMVSHRPVLHAIPQPIPAHPVAEPTPVKPVEYSLPASNAAQLQIPDIGVNAPVMLVGKKADGSMQVPSNPKQVGQYKHAPTPGEIGPSIIVGHVDSLTGPAVFWRLRYLVPGQIIKVVRADGTTATFKIESVKDFPQNNMPTEEVYGNISYAGLRLITCGGTFDYKTRHYTNNTVVFARLVQ